MKITVISFLRELKSRLIFHKNFLFLLGVVLLIFVFYGAISFMVAPLFFVLIAMLALFFVGSQKVRTSFQKISERERAASVVERMASKLPVPCIILNDKFVIEVINKQARRLLSLKKTGDPLFFHLRSPEVLMAVQDAVSSKQSQQCLFYQRVPTERWFDIHVTNLTIGRKRSLKLIMILTDLTSQKRHERMRSDFVANASHELRTPLSSLLGFIETLQGAAKDDVQARTRFLSIMRDQAERMSRLIDDLLSLSRIEMRAHLQPDQSLILNDVLLHICETLQPLADEAGLVIEKNFEGEAGSVLGDRDELAQVFTNLIENAIKYGSVGQKIIVHLCSFHEAGRHYYDVRVEDFGQGIAAAHLPRLTERFYRIDAEDSRAKKGTGLGLAIVKHILNRHKGRLIIQSEIGKGSVFTARIPAETRLKPKQAN